MCGRLDYYLLSFSKIHTGSALSFQPASSARDIFWCPLLLAAVLDNIGAGLITSNYILPSSELEKTYRNDTFIGNALKRQQPTMAVPFWNLQFSGFWQLRPKNHDHPLSESKVTDMVQLRHLVHGALLNEDLFPLLQMESSREKLRKTLIQPYQP